MPSVTLRSRVAKAAAVTTMTLAALTPSPLTPAAYADTTIDITSASVPNGASDTIIAGVTYSCDANLGIDSIRAEAASEEGLWLGHYALGAAKVTCDGTSKTTSFGVRLLGNSILRFTSGQVVELLVRFADDAGRNIKQEKGRKTIDSGTITLVGPWDRHGPTRNRP